MPFLHSTYRERSAEVRKAGFTSLNFLPHASSSSFSSSFIPVFQRRLSDNYVPKNITIVKSAQRKVITSKIRRLHPSLLPSLMPVIPTFQQFRRDFGPPSIALDRILVSVLVLGVLHLLPTSRVLILIKLLGLLWPMLHPLLTGSRRNAQLRFSATQSPPLIVAGKLQVRTTSRGTVVRVSDGSDLSKSSKPMLTKPYATQHNDRHACALVVGGKIVDVVVGNTYLAPYPCIRRKVLNKVCAAIYADL
eukprot:gb/GEZJ01004457.1/.p1 GENE.gb/GEZJ01004457.1/~~gb/GEZJ01004457.1/.p1  ORF type:complete len:248 (-),score=21.47 gb/GEZJ01004457.1/:28-771(-)